MPKGGSKKGERRGGRAAGTPNKLTANAKEAIEYAFNEMGGGDALLAWGKSNPDEFYTRIWVKLLPLTLAGDKENPLEVITRTADAAREKLNRAVAAAEAKGAKRVTDR